MELCFFNTETRDASHEQTMGKGEKRKAAAIDDGEEMSHGNGTIMR